jgi:uncharacterized protein
MNNIARLLCAGALLAGAAPAHAQPSALGTWHGTLTTPGGPLTLVVTIRDAAGGTYAGDLESIDQGGGGKLPLAAVAITASTLAFTVPSIGATYEGTWKDGDGTWAGTFRQGMTLPLVLVRGAPARPVIEGLDGTWRAALRRDTTTLRLILRVRTGPRGTAATLDSPDLGALGLAVAGLARRGDSVAFGVPAGQVAFAGALGDGVRSIRGRWSRPGQADAAVTFVRDSLAPAARVRTQWPIIPQGYRAESVSFANPRDRTVTLAGTLTIPEGAGPFPAAVLISGSGPQDRDETIFGHRPFAVLADHLTRRGIAVLRYDDRGVGGSTGDHGRATSADFATDADAAVRYLLGRRDIRRDAIGLVGHSEGGMIGPIAAIENDAVAFLVLLAGPGTNTDQVMLSQRRLMGAAQGVPVEALDRTEPIMREMYRAVRAAPDSQQAATRVRAVLTPDALLALGASDAQREAIVAQVASPWMRYFLHYEPATVLSRVRVPVLAINGSLDRQVAAPENLAAMRVALARNRDATVRELPGLNHFFQTATTGAIGEYADIPETFAPSAMVLVADWIAARFGRR